MGSKRLDLLVITVLVGAAGILTLAAQPKLLVSAFLFFVVPACYLHLKKRFNYKKIVAAILSMGISLSALDFVMTSNRGWWLPRDQMLVFPGIDGFWSLDNTVWSFFFIFFLISFYEYFLDDERSKKISKHFRYFVWLPIIVTCISGSFILFFPPLTHPVIPYAYLALLFLPVFVPIALLILKKPNALELLGKFTLASGFFFFVDMTHELTALHTHQWYFPGQYIGIISVTGVTFPIEELVLFITFSTFSFLAYYELFVDDGR